MYERSAIVLERYFNNLFGFNEKVNLKTNYINYKELVEEIEKYQFTVEEEEKIINEFDKVANEIRIIQKEERRLYNLNIKLEEERDQLFNNLEENPDTLEKELEKKNFSIEKNNKELAELGIKFVGLLDEFNAKQKERNKHAKSRRIAEGIHIQLIENISEEIEKINIDKYKEVKDFYSSEQNQEQEEIINILINNGKDEKLKFNENVLRKAAEERNIIAKKEAECYITAYEKMKRLFVEINNDDIKIEKFKKILRDITVKLEFLKAEKTYVIEFLDNERLTAINGLKIHNQMMKEACDNYELDIQQIHNLYELILKEISGKATKKLYSDLYNKEYLKNIEEKEKNFEQETNKIKINIGAIFNQNYWRIEGIKNVYEVFQDEVSNKFEKDLSEFKLEDGGEEKTDIDDVLGLDNFDVEMHYKRKIETEDEEDSEEEKLNEVNEQKNKYNLNFQQYEEVDLDDEDEEDYEEYENDEFEDEDDFEELEYEDDEEDYEDEFDEEEIIEETEETEEESKNTKGILNKFFGDKKNK